MKILTANHGTDSPLAAGVQAAGSVVSAPPPRPVSGARVRGGGRGDCSGFTMIEIALSLAIIAFALVAIIGILPFGMNVQKDNRQETIINQDATVFLNAIRNGARGMDELTNSVVAVYNYVTVWNRRGNTYQQGPTTTFAYTRTNSLQNNGPTPVPLLLTNGYRIVGLLSTPKYFPAANGGFYSNHVVAYVRSISGPAVEKYPQTDPTVQQLALNYRLISEVLPYDTNSWYEGSWTNYLVSGLSTNDMIIRSNYYRMVKSFETNLHDVRLTFRWPLLPNGNAGPSRQLYRTMVSGVMTNDPPGFPYYFFKPRTYLKGT